MQGAGIWCGCASAAGGTQPASAEVGAYRSSPAPQPTCTVQHVPHPQPQRSPTLVQHQQSRQTWGMQAVRLDWNKLSGTIPASFTQLPDLTSVGVSPGNYQLCGAAPERARFVLCRQLGSFCHPGALLGTTCQQPLAARGLNLPRPVANGAQLLVRPCHGSYPAWAVISVGPALPLIRPVMYCHSELAR